MLYLEDGRNLRLLAGIPRRYMEKGVSVRGAASYFGGLDLCVTPDSPQVRSVTVSLILRNHAGIGPDEVYIRLPHPEKKPIRTTELGRIMEDGETLQIAAGALESTGSWKVFYE